MYKRNLRHWKLSVSPDNAGWRFRVQPTSSSTPLLTTAHGGVFVLDAVPFDLFLEPGSCLAVDVRNASAEERIRRATTISFEV